jgi:hypothetical protein
MNYTSYSPDSLPKSRDELKCELYPKNASQVWAEYELARARCSYYDDQIVCDAIERSHDVAHGLIGDVKPDRTQKFPNEKLVPEGVKSFNHLVKLCGEGMKKRGLEGQQVYVDRLREELLVIKQMKNADYFISYQKIMELARERTGKKSRHPTLFAWQGRQGATLNVLVVRVARCDIDCSAAFSLPR